MKEYLILAGAACVCGFFIIVLKNSKTAKNFILNSLAGYAAFGAVNLTAVLTGVGLGFNAWTIITAALLGLPGVTTMLFLKLIFK